jgi:translation elongation factor EF-G
VISYYELPLRQTLTDSGQPLQLDFIEQAKLLLEGFSGVKAEVPARLLSLRALAERDLEGAAALLRAVFPAIRAGRIEVVCLEEGRLEPYVQLRVKAPAEYCAHIGEELLRRSGSIDDLGSDAGHQVLVSVAPLERLLGFDGWLSAATSGRAIAEYLFKDYRARTA